MGQYLLYLIIGFLILEYSVSRILNYLNATRAKKELPEELKEFYDAEKYKKSLEYQADNQRLSFIGGSVSLVIIIGILMLGGFAFLDEQARSVTEHPILVSLYFFGVLFLASDILGIPFALYSTFVIEEKYGFNKTSVKTFILDKIKTYLLAVVIGGGLLSVFILFYTWADQYFWLYVWGAFMIFSLVSAMFFTSWILPLFNKLKPMEDGELRKDIEEYCNKVKFKLKNILVMDGSKRSSKANAFFSGIGPKKNIVLFDTLIEKHPNEELVSVLAHEVGHYKKKHIFTSFILSGLNTLIVLYILSLVIDSPALASALGAEEVSFHIGLLAFILLFTPISMITGIFMNIFSRKNEFEADRYAKETSDAKALQNALKRLSVENLSNLTPHPAYVFFHYSHPPLLKRLEALDK
ncbi:MAG: M48 family metallopeptidase [Bacteroidetes bacterium]|nr:M48 family metallopeptidase [Bacteroidota bacterium]